jgi:aldehyde dehydrogenase (NAD+)
LLETWHRWAWSVISAFNFPMAVFAWYAALALVCGNTLVWKPSEKTPLSALALNGLLLRTAAELGHDTAGLSEVLVGDRAVGEALVAHPGVKLVSATGSSAMGRAVGVACAASFKRSLLELGGNNAAIVCPSADLELVVRGVAFAAARRPALHQPAPALVHREIYPALVAAAGARVRTPAGRRSARRVHAGRPADRPARVRSYAARAR